MKKTRLIAVLSTFSGEEIKEFDKFISSPNSGCRKFIVNFFKLIKEYHPDFDENKIQKEKLFKALYKNKKYDDGLVRRMSSEIIKYALDYLSVKKFKDIPAFRNNCLLMELRSRKLDSLFESKSRQILNEIDENKFKDFYSQLDKYLTEIEIYNQKSIQNRPDMFEQSESVHESLIYLFSYMLFNNIDKFLLTNYKFRKNISKEFEENFSVADLFRITGDLKEENSPVFQAIYFSYNIIADKSDEESFKRLKNILSEHKDHFTKNQLRSFYSYIFYFYNHYNSRNSDRYFKDEFETYNLILDEELFLNYTPYMSLFFCRNFIIACRRSVRPDRIDHFLKNYSQYFIPENKNNIINYGRSLMMLTENNFEKVLEYSSLINIDVPQFNNDIKIMRVKCYYELGHSESLLNEIDSLKHFYRNIKADNPKVVNIGTSIIVGENFLKHITSLMRLKNKFSISRKKILIKEIEEEDLLNEKKWLLDTILNLKF